MENKKTCSRVATFNEYGTCIDCQGGFEGCLHNNLSETNEGVVCVTCGIKVK